MVEAAEYSDNGGWGDSDNDGWDDEEETNLDRQISV